MIIDKQTALRYIDELENYLEDIKEAKPYKTELDDLYSIIDENEII